MPRKYFITSFVDNEIITPPSETRYNDNFSYQRDDYCHQVRKRRDCVYTKFESQKTYLKNISE